MEFLNIFAMIGMAINDLLAILSIIGSVILFFGSFSRAPLKRYGQIADWSILGLIFGGGSQISMAITRTIPEQIGFVVRMTPTMVNGLLAFSLLLLIGRWWLRRNRYKLSQRNYLILPKARRMAPKQSR